MQVDDRRAVTGLDHVHAARLPVRMKRPWPPAAWTIRSYLSCSRAGCLGTRGLFSWVSIVTPRADSSFPARSAALPRRASSNFEPRDAVARWDTLAVGSSEFVGYCSFTKAIEHLGDRWSLLIVRELGMFGPQGFNDLVTGLPGRISRSVLADRLRRLETLGLVSRRDDPDPHPAYRLTAVGQGLMATLGSLRAWADTWLPDDPDMLERDPDIVLGWLCSASGPRPRARTASRPGDPAAPST